MKRLKFKVNPKAEYSMFSLIKEVNHLSCRIYISLENNMVEVENVDEQQLETVIDLVAKNFDILNVNIDNTADDTSARPTPTKVEEAPKQPKEPTVLEPQSEDDLIIKKIEFENEYVEGLLNALARAAYWAMFKANIPEDEVGKYILTCKSEMSMAYSNNEIVNFSVGDIVDCNFGTHLAGEIQGGHILAIVCNIAYSNMAYVVPIAKMIDTKKTPLSYIPFYSPNDVTYYYDDYSNSVALLDKAKYIRVERIRKVVGNAKPAFFKTLLQKLATTFDFTGSADSDATETISTASPAKNSVVEEKNTAAKKVSSEEAALLEVIGPALESLDTSVNPAVQLFSFLNEIGFDTSSEIVTHAFTAACTVKKINYENIILEIRNSLTELSENEIKDELKSVFKGWLEKHPEIAKKCPKISIMALLKVYAKKFA